MAISLFNTLGRRKEELVPLEPGHVGMYVCGPTVYDVTHMGHARSAVAFDVVRRHLEFSGYRVTFVRNITDVDDKLIAKARETAGPGEDLRDAVRRVAERYTEEFTSVMRTLNVAEPTHEPKATEHVREMLDLVKRILERGYAYVSGGDVYFRVRAMKGYGALSGRDVDELRAGARVAPGEAKEDPLDFALWKRAKEGEPAWDSPWGPGRPGWHIECTAMASKYLGIPFDIHAGGEDLIFPHHEDEIAQTFGAFGTELARYWLHNGMLTVNREKMSKSLGNFFTCQEVFERFEPAAVRLFLLSAHYRGPLDFSDAQLEDSSRALARLAETHARAAEAGLPARVLERRPVSPTPLMARYLEAMDEDFNTAAALGVVFEMSSEVNAALDAGEKERAGEAFSDLVTALAALGVEVAGASYRLAFPAAEPMDGERLEALLTRGEALSDAEVGALLAERARARAAREFALADRIRDALTGMVVLKDVGEGTQWRRVRSRRGKEGFLR